MFRLCPVLRWTSVVSSMLLMVLAFLTASALGRDAPLQTEYLIKQDVTCPNDGFFFQRKEEPNALDPSPCYLCFCKKNTASICWKRENHRCDARMHHALEHRETRFRRSPMALNELFFRDAARDLLSMQSESVCKPFESSYSEGCPPIDWCIGCTVCDCDAGGRWDCRTLSYCPKDAEQKPAKRTSKKKERQGPATTKPESKVELMRAIPIKNKVKEIATKAKRRASYKTEIPKRRPEGILKVDTIKSQHVSINKLINKMPKGKTMAKRAAPTRRPKKVGDDELIDWSAAQKRATKQVRSTPTRRSIYLNKNKSNSTGKPIQLLNAEQDPNFDLASSIVKRFMKAIAHFANKTSTRNTAKLKKNYKGRPLVKNNKRQASMTKNTKSAQSKSRTANKNKTQNNKTRKRAKPRRTTKKPGNQQRHKRNRRGIATTETSQLDNSNSAVVLNMTTTTTENSYFNTLSNFKELLSSENISSTSTEQAAQTTIMFRVKDQNLSVIPHTSQKIEATTDFFIYYANEGNVTESNIETPTAKFNTSNNNDQTINKIDLDISENSRRMINSSEIFLINVTEQSNLKNLNFLIKSSESFSTPANNQEILNKIEDEIIATPLQIQIYTATDEGINQPVTKASTLKADVITENYSGIKKKKLSDVNVAKMEKELPDINDLKFNNWPKLKLLETELVRNRFFVEDNAYALPTKLKFSSKDVQKDIQNQSKKNSIDRVIKSLNKTDQEKITIKKTGNKIFDKLHQFRRKRPGLKKYAIFKYLRKFFRKLFGVNKKKGYVTKVWTDKKDIKLMKIGTIQRLCKDIVTCKMNSTNTTLIKSKLDTLNAETFKIFEAIKTIKGLLHLIDVAKNETISANITLIDENYPFKKDIGKLYSILKKSYLDVDSELLSFTERTQIEYIRRNVNNFITSVATFATVLQDIINILATNYQTQHGRVPRKTRYVRVEESQTESPKIAQDLIDRLRTIIMKYNIMENKFFQRINNVLGNLENNIKSKDIKEEVKTINIVKPLNKTESLSYHAHKIIKNIQQLKDLAQRISEKNIRVKRGLGAEDGALEYLLMMMEYLLKKNSPLDGAPVNDGIDLLIDAIRSAPDIKPIKKKVLNPNHFPQNKPELRAKLFSPKNEEIENAITNKSIQIFAPEVTPVISSNQVIEETVETITSEELYDDIPVKNITRPKTVTEQSKLHDQMNMKQFKNKDVIPKKEIDNNIRTSASNSKQSNDKDNDISKFEVLDVYAEDDMNENPTTERSVGYEVLNFGKNTNKNMTISVVPLKDTKTGYKLRTFNTEYTDNSGDLDDVTDIKANLKETTTNNSNKKDTTPSTTKVYIFDASAISKGLEDDDENTKQIKMNEVIYKKQMDLLNSLDYGNERIDDSDSDTKDENAFPTYFL